MHRYIVWKDARLFTRTNRIGLGCHLIRNEYLLLFMIAACLCFYCAITTIAIGTAIVYV